MFFIICLFIRSIVYLFVYLFIHLFTHSFTHSFTHLFTHLFIHFSIHLVIHLFVYLLISICIYIHILYQLINLFTFSDRCLSVVASSIPPRLSVPILLQGASSIFSQGHGISQKFAVLLGIIN